MAIPVAMRFIVQSTQSSHYCIAVAHLCVPWSLSCSRGLRRVFGHRLSNAAFSLWFYLFKRANPILQIVYLVLVNGGWVLFYINGQSKYIPKESIHHAFIDLTLLANFVSFMLCSTSNPGVVTRENAPQLVRMFPYDNQLYLPKVMCPTCVVEKPARSKHCSYCDRCVMKFDHQSVPHSQPPHSESDQRS